MIDTLGINLAGQVKDDLPEEWKRERWSDGLINVEGGFMRLPTGFLRHKTGLRIGINGGRACWAELELSRLLFSSNGILIKTQEQLDQAVKQLIRLLNEVCKLDPDQTFPLRRIDLVGHAKMDPQLLVRVYKNFPLPGIHKFPVLYPKESLFWKGTRQKCRIYDTQLKQTGQGGEISRIEWELHGSAITRTFGQALNLSSLSIRECYSVFQRLCQQFAPRHVSKSGDLPSILAMANEENWCYRGIPLADQVKGWRNPKVFRRLMKQAASQELDLTKVDLASQFPPQFEDYLSIDMPCSFATRRNN